MRVLVSAVVAILIALIPMHRLAAADCGGRQETSASKRILVNGSGKVELSLRDSAQSTTGSVVIILETSGLSGAPESLVNATVTLKLGGNSVETTHVLGNFLLSGSQAKEPTSYVFALPKPVRDDPEILERFTRGDAALLLELFGPNEKSQLELSVSGGYVEAAK